MLLVSQTGRWWRDDDDEIDVDNDDRDNDDAGDDESHDNDADDDTNNDVDDDNDDNDETPRRTEELRGKNCTISHLLEAKLLDVKWKIKWIYSLVFWGDYA